MKTFVLLAIGFILLFLRDSVAKKIPENSKSKLDPKLAKIRCPICKWEPQPFHLWCCGYLYQEDYMGCGTWWNTFETKGECPGCNHKWIWTTCLRCDESSRHEDWYEKTA